MKTWKVELLVVSLLLLIINIIRDNLFTVELLAAFAVILSFGHAQIADRLAEKEGQKETPDVSCYKKLRFYFIGKELFWCLYFFLNHSYSALVGVFIFLAYPFWRKLYRTKIKSI